MQQRVTIKELETLIPTIAETLTPIIQSEAGCGKTSILKMLKEDLGEDEYDYIYVDFKPRFASAFLKEVTPWLSLLTTALLTYSIITP